jgi:hypothetical protein
VANSKPSFPVILLDPYQFYAEHQLAPGTPAFGIPPIGLEGTGECVDRLRSQRIGKKVDSADRTTTQPSPSIVPPIICFRYPVSALGEFPL